MKLWEDHQDGEAKYEKIGDYWEVTVRGLSHGKTWEEVEAFTYKTDARKWAVSMVGRRVT